MFSVKLYNDGEIKFSKYREIKPLYKQVSIDQKQNLETKKIVSYTYKDALNATKVFDASIKRTKKRINELSTKNNFDYFITITFNQDYVNRRDPQEVHALFKNIIKRLKYNYAGLKYIAVPEFHKDNETIHYHMLCSFGKTPKLKYKGRTPRGQRFYTFFDSFKKEDCFLTVEKINTIQPISYLTKCLTKNHYYPLFRRYVNSRSLVCQKLQEKTSGFSEETSVLSDAEVLAEVSAIGGLSCHFWRNGNGVYASSDSATPKGVAVDLSNVCTKDEKLKERKILYEKIVAFIESCCGSPSLLSKKTI